MMFARTTGPRNRQRRVRDESSNSFAMFMIMLPMIMGAFGIGLDMSRNVYIRTTLQNGLDMATVSGAGVTVVNKSGRVDIVADEALQTVEQVYALNRESGPPLQCIGEAPKIKGSSSARCWKLWGAPTVNRAYIRYGVRERSKNAFLPVIGVVWQDYHIESRARVLQSGQ